MVVLNVYDLQGVRLGRRALGVQSSGPQSVEWDGRDAAGQMPAPGLYLIEIALESEFKTFRHLQPLGVAYQWRNARIPRSLFRPCFFQEVHNTVGTAPF